jgi:hypothetical protein
LSFVAACQGPGRESADIPVAAPIQVRDGRNTVVAELRPGHPCRATIGPIEMFIGGPPLIAQVGEVRWTGEARDNGTIVLRDGTAVARVLDRADQLGVYDPSGVPIVKISGRDGDAVVADASSRLVRHITPGQATLAIDTPPLIITGTKDARLAALLTASELSPELRMLAACNRVL